MKRSLKRNIERVGSSKMYEKDKNYNTDFVSNNTMINSIVRQKVTLILINTNQEFIIISQGWPGWICASGGLG